MINVAFCCHGNICRSPLAQSVFAHLVREEGLENQFQIDSFATSREELGNSPHPGTVKKLREMGIPLVPHRAKQISWEDYKRQDYILAMDEYNVKRLHQLLKGDTEGKVNLLLAFGEREREIADPWYTGDFDATYEDVLEGCQGFLKYLKDHGKIEEVPKKEDGRK